jgi:hypothetical protein
MIIKMLLNMYKKVRKASIFNLITATKQLVRKRGWIVTYRNVPRALNVAADDMCRRALSLVDS